MPRDRDNEVIAVRPVAAGDIDQLVDLNNAAVPAVSVADAARMAELVDLATFAWVVDNEGSPSTGLAGFVLLFDPDSTYDSLNYRWFCGEFDSFLYVDRIVIGEHARGGGIGAALYEAVFAEASGRGDKLVTAEVNVIPPNPGSSRFHRRLGFEQVGILAPSDEYQVEMLAHVIA